MGGSGVTQAFNLYLIRRPRGRCLFFTPTDQMEAWEQKSDDHIHKAIVWLKSRRNRIAAWFGRLLESARAYHGTLEDRLDPAERILRAMAATGQLVIHHGTFPSQDEIAGALKSSLWRQRIKHKVWFVLDMAAIAVASLLTPIPGPNVVLYYPVLRIFSHYRALKGVAVGMDAERARFQHNGKLDDLESALRTPSPDHRNIGSASDALNLQGLSSFLERML
jgi:hypothetical protein